MQFCKKITMQLCKKITMQLCKKSLKLSKFKVVE